MVQNIARSDETAKTIRVLGTLLAVLSVAVGGFWFWSLVSTGLHNENLWEPLIVIVMVFGLGSTLSTLVTIVLLGTYKTTVEVPTVTTLLKGSAVEVVANKADVNAVRIVLAFVLGLGLFFGSDHFWTNVDLWLTTLRFFEPTIELLILAGYLYTFSAILKLELFFLRLQPSGGTLRAVLNVIPVICTVVISEVTLINVLFSVV